MLILIIFIFIIFYLINNYVLKQESKEHFLTYFLPYYYPKLNSLANFYHNNEENLNYFKKKFTYDVIEFCCTNLNKTFISKFISIYISQNKIYNIKIIIDDDILNKLNDLIDNKLNYLVIDYPTIFYLNNILKKEILKLKMVTNLYRLYYYFFTKKKYKVYSIDNIPPNFIIGILDYPNPFYLYFFTMMKDLGYNIKTDFKLKKYKNLNSLLEGFSNDECNMIIFNEVFPNKDINNFLNEKIDDIILIPFNIIGEELFLKRNKCIKIDYIDLNKLAVSYLPKNFGGYIYNTFKPDFKIIYNEKIIITNIDNKKEIVYDLIKFYNIFYKIINKNINDEEGFKLYKTNLSLSTEILDFHEGALDYLSEKGYISYNNNPNCLYLAGSMECTDKNLADNNLSVL
jgi:hypothetical protein